MARYEKRGGQKGQGEADAHPPTNDSQAKKKEVFGRETRRSERCSEVTYTI